RYRCDRIKCTYGPPEGSVAARDVDLTAFRANPVAENVPRCPACGGYLRMHVLWFDEYYHEHKDYQFDRVVRAPRGDAELVVFAGTSFSVGVTDLVFEGAQARGVPMFNIDPQPRVAAPGVTNVVAASEVALVEACKALGVEVASGPA